MVSNRCGRYYYAMRHPETCPPRDCSVVSVIVMIDLNEVVQVNCGLEFANWPNV